VRHALVREQQGDPVVANLQTLQQVERPFRGIAAQDSVGSAILRSQIAFDGPQDIGIVVDGQQNRLRHDLLEIAFGLRMNLGVPEIRIPGTGPNKLIRY